ncbi:MAG: triose-phosphate isomerase [Patescibacteria group bacterium]|nr:triose-phosphate isomerase [Patescibacteria group bacterium]
MKTIHLFANWKMYLDFDESNILANALAAQAKKNSEQIKIAVFPSALALYPVGQVLKDVGLAVGAQNAYWVDKGGFTGEVSVNMFKEAGCEYALIGHSERRHIFNETNHEVRQKLEAALAVGLTPVICVGETAEERRADKTEEVVEIQLRSALDKLAVGADAKIFIAYEPVWAIGTGDACAPGEAERMHGKISKIVTALLPKVDCKILYGGSVRPANVADYLIGPLTDGVLIGHASAQLDSFSEIIKRAGELAKA